MRAESLPRKIGSVDTTLGSVRHPDGVIRPVDASVSRFRGWIVSEAPREQLDMMCVAAHEETHALQAYYPYVILQRAGRTADDFTRFTMYTVDGNRGVLVRRLRDFLDEIPSVAIVEDKVPTALRSDRYDPYIRNREAHDGVFGLLDEFDAYYQTVHTAYDLYGYVRDELPDDGQTWKSYLELLGMSYSDAYAEFRYFVLVYMTTLKGQDPQLYQRLMDDGGVPTAFTLIDTAFTDLAKAARLRVREEIPGLLQSRGYRVTTRDSDTPVGSASGTSINATYLDIRGEDGRFQGSIWLESPLSTLLGEETAKPVYQAMLLELRRAAQTGTLP